MAEKRQLDPIKGEFPDQNKIPCADCFNRDREEVRVGSRVIKCGVTRAFCNAYPPPPDSNGKPLEILFHGAKCKFYAKDEAAT